MSVAVVKPRAAKFHPEAAAPVGSDRKLVNRPVPPFANTSFMW
jgi:hypothetical protein